MVQVKILKDFAGHKTGDVCETSDSLAERWQEAGRASVVGSSPSLFREQEPDEQEPAEEAEQEDQDSGEE